MLLFAETGAEAAMQLAEAIRAHIEGLQLIHPRSTTSPWITVSIGVSTIHPQQLDNTESLFIAADRAMYAAKEGGRNQIRATATNSPTLEAVKALMMRQLEG